MYKNDVRLSGFSLSKEKDLTGDDFDDFKSIGSLNIAVVCDGVGSADEGAEAAKRVTTYLMNNFKARPKSWSIEKSIVTFIKSINSILFKESMMNFQRAELITTLAIVVIEGNRLYGANVGDSRVYLLRDENLNQLSSDHSMDDGTLLQAIGIEKDVEPYYFENIVQKDDRILLCSDGLYTVMSDNSIKHSLHLGASVLVKTASKIMQDHLPDDTTAVVMEVLEANEVELLKHQSIDIPIKLKKDQIIDGYKLEKALIQNHRTWLCSKDDQLHVLKFAPLEAIDSEEILDLFVKEAWNAKRLKADYFPKAFIPKDRSSRYYVMQYFKGEDLGSYLRHKKITIDAAVELASTLLEMSQFLLRYDLVHGDIKPENIMIDKNDDTLSYKIIDFGSITEIFSTDTKAGTPSFLSPERFNNESISESSEIFAIGVTLYLSLTGRYPYGEIEPFQTPKFKEAKKPSTFNKNIPPWLDSVILRSISIDKELRYSHYSEMMHEIKSPQKVKPFFPKDSTLIQRSPLTFYKTAFIVMTIINFILLILMNS